MPVRSRQTGGLYKKPSVHQTVKIELAVETGLNFPCENISFRLRTARNPCFAGEARGYGIWYIGFGILNPRST